MGKVETQQQGLAFKGGGQRHIRIGMCVWYTLMSTGDSELDPGACPMCMYMIYRHIAITRYTLWTNPKPQKGLSLPKALD